MVLRLIPTAMVATVLMIMAAFAFYHGQMLGGLAFLAGSGVLFFRFATGDRDAGIADVESTMEFVRDPAGSIVDAVFDRLPGGDQDGAKGKDEGGPIDRLTSWLSDDSPDAATDKAFDADAALARYMANRPEDSPAVDVPALQPAAPRGFGRKGL